MRMGSIGSGDELMHDVSGSHEDKIFVSIRLRPLSEKEIAKHDVSDWECINQSTLIFKNTLPERSMYPSAYTFDRVFGCDSTTKQVYEEGAKEVALAVVSGINSSIFAYGQTSSGKTYTMCGITEFAVTDIYDYVEQHTDREFVMKFSAMEIYNEAVRDLLSSDSTPLRVLDDPERGTVVEKLTEETLRDRNHLAELLYVCEAQRKIGETSLNETSSRSHQILRLTIESSAREFLRAENSSTLTATVNFVDLAGSERASQTLSAGTRLKEGCHINRSLLTLGTVIRKLSKGRSGHIPYRDSKLTRILQNSLGGNAKTAIICTMSPARNHVEQSRNTLLFASCAKEVSTNAQVNVLMSDKALVKQLQRELTRLESHMRSLESTSASGVSDTAALLRERELQIEKMEKRIKELTQQRDIAQARVEDLLRLVEEDQASRLDEYSTSRDSSDITDPLYMDAGFRVSNPSKNFVQPSVRSSNDHYLQVPDNPEDNFLLDHSTPKFYGPDPFQVWEEIPKKIDEKSEDICKDVRCIEVEESSIDRIIETDVTLPSPERKEENFVIEVPTNEDEMSSSPQKEDRELNHMRADYVCDALKQKNHDMHEDAISSPRKEDKDGDAISSPRKEDRDGDAITSLQTEDRDGDAISSLSTEDRDGDEISSPQKEVRELSHVNADYICDALKQKIEEIHEDAISSPQKEGKLNHMNAECACEALQQKIEDMQKTIKRLVSQNILEQSPCTKADTSTSCGSIKLARSRSCTAVLMTLSSSPWFGEAVKDANALPSRHEKEIIIPQKPEQKSKSRSHAKKEKYCRQDSMKSVLSACLPAEHIKMDDSDVDDYYRGLKEGGGNELETSETEDEFTESELNAGSEIMLANSQPQHDWPLEFQRQRSQIIELWAACNVPLVHRTYFFLLFKGDPSDSIYMEVELRRLSFLKTSLSRGTNPMKNNLTLSKASSMRALIREREMLSRQVHKKMDKNEREALYKKWGINLSTKQRSLQLANRVWTDTRDLHHVEESAALVAKLVQLIEPGRQVPKEMFGLSFSLGPAADRRSYSWKA